MSGKLTKIVEFGIFVELEPELQGLLHRSEIPDAPPAEVGPPGGLSPAWQETPFSYSCEWIRRLEKSLSLKLGAEKHYQDDPERITRESGTVRIWGQVLSMLPGHERSRPGFLTARMLNRVLSGDMVENPWASRCWTPAF